MAISAMRQMQLEMKQCEARAKRGARNPETHELGILRLDLIRECHRRLDFLKYMNR
jgi:hypothetical protein